MSSALLLAKSSRHDFLILSVPTVSLHPGLVSLSLWAFKGLLLAFLPLTEMLKTKKIPRLRSMRQIFCPFRKLIHKTN